VPGSYGLEHDHERRIAEWGKHNGGQPYDQELERDREQHQVPGGRDGEGTALPEVDCSLLVQDLNDHEIHERRRQEQVLPLVPEIGLDFSSVDAHAPSGQCGSKQQAGDPSTLCLAGECLTPPCPPRPRYQTNCFTTGTRAHIHNKRTATTPLGGLGLMHPIRNPLDIPDSGPCFSSPTASAPRLVGLISASRARR
jgi:hypothetical protein